jgi:hypothetical protein
MRFASWQLSQFITYTEKCQTLDKSKGHGISKKLALAVGLTALTGHKKV